MPRKSATVVQISLEEAYLIDNRGICQMFEQTILLGMSGLERFCWLGGRMGSLQWTQKRCFVMLEMVFTVRLAIFSPGLWRRKSKYSLWSGGEAARITDVVAPSPDIRLLLNQNLEICITWPCLGTCSDHTRFYRIIDLIEGFITV